MSRIELDELTFRFSSGLEIRLSLATQTCCLWRPLSQSVTLTFNELESVLLRLMEKKEDNGGS